MQDNKPRSTRRAVIAGALALTGAPFIRRASAQPAAGVSLQLAELYEKAKPEAEVTIWAPGAPSVQWIPAEFAKRQKDDLAYWKQMIDYTGVKVE